MIEIKENEPLKNYSTFRVGGPAKYFVVAKSAQDVKDALAWAKQHRIECKIIGGGSNILASDKGFDGLVIKIFGSHSEFDGELMTVFAGTPLPKVINDSFAQGLLGLEWAVGIPGTVGGAVHNNAGAYQGDMSQVVESVTILRKNEIIELNNDDCEFVYRGSRFKTDQNTDIIISVKLRLKLADPDQVAKAKEQAIKTVTERNKKYSGYSAGSTFKNLLLSDQEIREFKRKYPEFPDEYVGYKKIPAAWLIDHAELRGRVVGGAKVSDAHAGVIINTGTATASDIVMLISIVKQKIRVKYGLQLMEEIEYLGF